MQSHIDLLIIRVSFWVDVENKADIMSRRVNYDQECRQINSWIFDT